MREAVPQEMKATLHRTTRRHQGRQCVQYQTCTSQDEGRNVTQENRKCCIVKDITRLFRSDCLKALGTI